MIQGGVIELDKKIGQIQKSTRTLFPTFLSVHNKLRMKYKWYYDWHLLNYSTAIHTLSFIVFVLISILSISSVFITNPKTTKAGGGGFTVFTWTGAGDGSSWTDELNWDIGAGYPDNDTEMATIPVGFSVTTPSDIPMTLGGLGVSGTMSLGNDLDTTANLDTFTIFEGGVFNTNNHTVILFHLYNYGTINAGSSLIQVGGEWRNLLGTFNAQNSTVESVNSAYPADFITGGTETGKTFYNLIISQTTDGSFAGGNIKVTNDLTISEASTFTLNDLFMGGENTASTLEVGGDFTNNGTLVADKNELNAMTFGGNFANNGTITVDTFPPVTFNGTGTSVISGDTTFDDLNFNTSSGSKTINFASGSTQTIASALSFTTFENKVLTLGRSGGSGTDQWNLSIASNIESGVDYVSVSNGRILDGKTITLGINSIVGSNTTGWLGGAPAEPEPTPTPTPTPSTSTTPSASTSTPTPTASSSSTTSPSASPSTLAPIISLLDNGNNSLHYLTKDSNPTIYTQRPTFSGTTYPDSKVEVVIHSRDPIKINTTSDKNGYWSVTLNQDLSQGEHTIQITVTTPENKIITSDIQAFTIASAEVNLESQVRDEKINQNMLTISSFIILLVVIGSVIVYGSHKKKK